MIKYFQKVILGLLGLALCLTFLGCSVTKDVQLDEFHEAMRLVDQGTSYLRTLELDKAQASFKAAAETSPLAAAHDGLGCVAFMQGEYKKAEQYFWEAYDMDNTYYHSLGNLALLYETMGYKAKAEKMYLEAIEENPKNHQFRNNYAVFLAGYESRVVDWAEVQNELLKAQALVNHPVIEENLTKVEKR